MNKQELIEKIIKKYGLNNSGCYINNVWFSPCQILKLINELEERK